MAIFKMERKKGSGIIVKALLTQMEILVLKDEARLGDNAAWDTQKKLDEKGYTIGIYFPAEYKWQEDGYDGIYSYLTKKGKDLCRKNKFFIRQEAILNLGDIYDRSKARAELLNKEVNLVFFKEFCSQIKFVPYEKIGLKLSEKHFKLLDRHANQEEKIETWDGKEKWDSWASRNQDWLEKCRKLREVEIDL